MDQRALESEATFREAQAVAESYAMRLTNPSAGCYQLRGHWPEWKGGKLFIINFYPRRSGYSPRVYHDPNHQGPFLEMAEHWTLLGAVEAAIQATE